jgi:hypothetical protein
MTAPAKHWLDLIRALGSDAGRFFPFDELEDLGITADALAYVKKHTSHVGGVTAGELERLLVDFDRLP